MSDKGPKANDPRWVEQVTDEMMEAIKAKAVDGKVTCPYCASSPKTPAWPTR